MSNFSPSNIYKFFYSRRVIFCLILGLSLSAHAKTNHKSGAHAAKPKKIVTINLEPTKKPKKSRASHPAKNKALVEVAFGATTNEGEVEPLTSTQQALLDKKASKIKTVKAPRAIVVLEDRKVASREEPITPPNLKNLLQKYEKEFEAEIDE